MAGANTKTFTDGNFKSEVLDSATPVLVDFWAEWCQPCKMLGPTIDALADEFAGKVKVGKMDTDSNRNTAVQFGISAIPTVILLQHGHEAKRFVGMKGKAELAAAMDAAVKGTLVCPACASAHGKR